MGLALHNFHDVKGFFSPHANGCNFLNADGSARLIADDVDLTTFRALATRAGGEAVSVP